MRSYRHSDHAAVLVFDTMGSSIIVILMFSEGEGAMSTDHSSLTMRGLKMVTVIKTRGQQVECSKVTVYIQKHAISASYQKTIWIEHSVVISTGATACEQD